MRGRTLAALATAALVLPAPAAAKELVRATICGTSGCTTITDQETLWQIPAGETTAMLGPVKPYYTVEVVNDEPGYGEHSFSMYYVPAANGMAWAENELVRLHPIYGEPTTELMRRLVERIEPFPAPRITSARVGGRNVVGREARTYGRLFAEKRVVDLAVPPTDWVEIDLTATRPSPWTDSRADLVYSPSAGVLETGFHRIEIDEELAADLEAGRALAEESRDFPWLAVLFAAVGALALTSIHARGR